MEGMTQEQVDEIKARVDAATPGPWLSRTSSNWVDGKRTTTEYFVMREDDDVAVCADCVDPNTSKPSEANADFIAYAREDIPALLAEVERLQAENARLRDRLTAATDPAQLRFERMDER
jgi:hypothetical protein